MSSNNLGGRKSTSHSIALDAALVHATLDQNVALEPPFLIPAVLNFPVVNAVKGAITDQGHGVASQSRSCLVCVHTGLVGWEIAIDSQCDIHGAVGVKVLHDLVDIADRVRSGCVGLVCIVGGGVAILRACRLAFRGS